MAKLLNTPSFGPVTMPHFPELMKLQEEFKNKTLLEYVQEHLLKERAFLPLDQEAYHIFCLNFGGKKVRRLSTGSHQAFLQWDEPSNLGENILANLPALLQGTESVVSAPCSRITFKNSTRPGTLDLSGLGSLEEKNLKLSRYTLRGRSKITVNKAARITEPEMKSFLLPFRKFQNQAPLFKFINQEKLSFFLHLAEQMVGSGETFNEQSSWFSSQLWPHLFNGLKASPLTIKPLEDLQVKRENLLADKKMRVLLEKYFKDSYGALSSTYFYYGSCACGIEFPLEKREEGELVYLEGNCLDKNCPHFGAENGAKNGAGYGTRKYRVEVNDLLSEVEKKNLNETLFITFYNIWALAGIEVLGGCNQAEYLKEFKDKLGLVFEERGDKKKSEILRKRATNLLDLGLVVAFNHDGTPTSGSQLLLGGGLERSYLEQLSRLNFSTMVELSLPFINCDFGEKPDYALTAKKIQENKMGFMIK